MLTGDTIAAIVTPRGRGGMGVIRISGPACLEIASKVITILKKDIKPQEIYFGKVKDIDQVIYYFFKSPRSYTGEDSLEIGCHGSVAVLGAVMGKIIEAGARQARPGEFSFRAFINGKIDLTQAEAILELVDAKTEKAARLAFEELSGTTRNKILKIRKSIFDGLTEIEGAIDFPDDMETPANKAESAMGANIEALERVLKGANSGIVYREGFRVAIVGRANVGKSTLLNRLLKWERAIVSPCPGTTRDAVSEGVELEGVPIKLVDTAGIEEGRSGPEGEGIDRAKREAQIADLVLMVVDNSKVEGEEDLKIIREIDKERILMVLNKSDLEERTRLTGTKVSALTGDGVETLEAQIIDRINAGKDDGQVLISQRQNECLVRAKEALQRAHNSARIGVGEEAVAVDLRAAIEALDQSMGIGIGDEVVRAIFANFCVGK